VTTQEQEDLIVVIAAGILCVVREKGTSGAPAGHLYAAVMSWLNLDAFEIVMAKLEQMGMVVKRGQCYYATQKLAGAR